MLTLGWFVGGLITQSARRLVEHYFPPGERQADRAGESTSAPRSAGSEAGPRAAAAPRHHSSMNPCGKVCKFSNTYNNCWMNASLQAVLNLRVVQETLAHLPPENLTPLSTTPEFAALFLRALGDPGRIVTSGENYGALAELSDRVPALQFSQPNDIHDLLEHFLSWLGRCGVGTTLQVDEAGTCERCTYVTRRISDLRVYFLPPADKHDTILSLLTRDFHAPTQCLVCGSTVQTRRAWSRPDLLTFCLSRTAHDGSTLGKPVTPSEFIDIPLDGDTAQRYRLSSVICHRGFEASGGHFWSYLLKDHVTVQADDDRVSVVAEGRPADICELGVVYFYERCAQAGDSPSAVGREVSSPAGHAAAAAAPRMRSLKDSGSAWVFSGCSGFLPQSIKTGA